MVFETSWNILSFLANNPDLNHTVTNQFNKGKPMMLEKGIRVTELRGSSKANFESRYDAYARQRVLVLNLLNFDMITCRETSQEINYSLCQHHTIILPAMPKRFWQEKYEVQCTYTSPYKTYTDQNVYC